MGQPTCEYRDTFFLVVFLFFVCFFFSANPALHTCHVLCCAALGRPAKRYYFDTYLSFFEVSFLRDQATMSQDDAVGISLDDFTPSNDSKSTYGSSRVSGDAWFGGDIDGAGVEEASLPPEFDSLVAVGDADDKFLEEQDVTVDMVRPKLDWPSFCFFRAFSRPRNEGRV
jgi:hypothetical protein